MTSKTAITPSQASLAVTISDDPRRVRDHYSSWAVNYDQELDPETYFGPALGADEVARLVPEDLRAQVRILDVGAGTGKVGFELKKRGFTHLDALEPCQEMLDILRTKGLYQNIYHEFFGMGQCTIPDDSYDIVVVIGCMSKGHIPVSGIDEMIRVAKPGGLVVNLTREEVLEVPMYKDKLKPHIDQQEKEGKWKQVTWEILPEFVGDKRGLLFSYRVL